MNITIYYLTKKIILQQKNQITENQSIIDLDLLKKNELFHQFELFINQSTNDELIFKTSSPEEGLEKLSHSFKYIFAAGGLIEKEGKYLFIFRLKTWDLPKGKLDKGESPEEAAIRECEEECGIGQLTITRTLEPTYHIYPYKGAYALKKTWWYAMQTGHSGTLVPQVEENIERVEWFSKQEIKEQVVANTYPAILEVIRELI
jgi:8-oxo-dGTP pyrophosphatase MutT (NUDIX family)